MTERRSVNRGRGWERDSVVTCVVAIRSREAESVEMEEGSTSVVHPLSSAS